MKRRLTLVLTLLLSVVAMAGGSIKGNPTDLRPTRTLPLKDLRDGLHPTAGWRGGNSYKPQGISQIHHRPAAPSPAILTGAVADLWAVEADGTRTRLTFDGPLDLARPLPVPDWPIADLEIVLAEAPRLSVAALGRILQEFDRATLTVAIDDPDAAAAAGWVALDLDADLSELDPRSLADGLIATPLSPPRPAR